MPTVFISYAHGKDGFRDDVKELGSWLADRGCTVVSDIPFRYKPPTLGWLTWMNQGIREADVVLVVCTLTLCERYEKSTARWGIRRNI